MTIDQNTSRKLKRMSFLAAVSVVCLHTLPENFSWFARFHDWAVPYFFLSSGFFCDRKLIYNFNFKLNGDNGLIELYSKKIKTLLIPYIFWGIIYGGTVTTLLWFIINNKNKKSLFENTFLGEHDFISAIDHLFGIFRNSPANPIFWFVRVLIIIFFTIPIWIFIRKISKWLLLLLSIIGIAYFTPVSFVTPCETFGKIAGHQLFFKAQGLAWFLLGMSASAFIVEKYQIKKWMIILSLILWYLSVYFQYFRLFPIFIIIFVWGLQDYFDKALSKELSWWIGSGMFIYGFHQPVSTLIKGFFNLLGKSIIVQWFMLLFAWIIVLIITIFAAAFVRRFTPKFYLFITGGRG